MFTNWNFIYFYFSFAINRELIFPRRLDSFYPWFLNHMVHTNIMIFISIEMILLHHRYTSLKASFKGIAILTVAYSIWISIIKYKVNVWVYPFLAILSWPQRMFVPIVTLFIIVVFYLMGRCLNTLVWSKSRNSKRTTQNDLRTKQNKLVWFLFFIIIKWTEFCFKKCI